MIVTLSKVSGLFIRIRSAIASQVGGGRVRLRVSAALLTAVTLAGCATNPVTGRNELSFVSEREEVNIGQQHYGPTQQSQGGAYSVDTGLTRYVNEVGQRLAAVSDRDLPYEFVVLNSSVPNAWALPGGKIAINRGLLTELTNEAELAAVLGHEIVHAAARHGAQNMERGMLMQGAMIATAIAASDSQYAGLIVGGAQVGAQLISTRYGREAERESDLYGMRYMVEAGYDPAAAVSLQQTFVRLSEGRASGGWLEGLFASHPPSIERVQNNQEMLEQMRAQGVRGELHAERYQANTAMLRETKPAYDLHDEALALLQQDRFEDGQAKLDQAIAMFPREARFHGLKGDVAMHQRNYQAAEQHYNRAIERDPNFFNYYLGRGMSFVRRGERSRGEADLQRSVELLPTAAAMNELGALALQRNDRAAAREYYQVAAGAGGPAGEQARAAFARLDITENPQQYIQVQPFVNNGRLGARIINQSPVEVSALVVEFQAVTGGQRVTRNITVPRLAGGQTVDVDSTIPMQANPGGAPQAGAVLRSLEVR